MENENMGEVMTEETPVIEEKPDIEIEPYAEKYVEFDTFAESDFRVVKVKNCEAVPKSKKLLRFTLDDGSGKERTILSGVHAFYEPEELVGKTLLAIVNLPPRSMMGIRDLFDVTDKTIRDDLAYIQDVMGVIIESKPGVGGYVRISQEWRKRKCPMTPVQEQAMLTVYKAETNPELKMVLLGIMMDYCSPYIYENEL